MLRILVDGYIVLYEIIKDLMIFVRNEWKKIFLILIVVGSFISFLVLFLHLELTSVLINVFEGFVSIPIAYISVKFIYTYSPTERKRLMDPEKCVEFYKDTGLDFIKYNNKNYPTIIYFESDTMYTLDDIHVEIVNDMYHLSERIRNFYEPIEDKIKKRFIDEGYFNAPKAKLIEFEKEYNIIKVKLQETFYYYTFITNFMADYPLYKNMTLRKAYKDEFIENVCDLNLNFISNHLGFGGIVITKDGKIPLFLRKGNNAISSRMIANSFNGSVDWYGKESLEKSIKKEIYEELGLNITSKNLIFLGMELNILFLGKTDMHFLIIVNEDFDNLKKNIKVSKNKFENFMLRKIDLNINVTSIDDLINNNGYIEDKIHAEISNLEKKYKISVPLISNLYLFEKFIKNILINKEAESKK